MTRVGTGPVRTGAKVRAKARVGTGSSAKAGTRLGF